MNYSLLFDAGPVVVTHVVAALAAFALGLVMLFRRKGGTFHRYSGRVWVALMILVAFSSFFINEIRMIGPFSPIHGISVYVIVTMVWAVLAVRSGNIERHKSLMKANFFWGMIVAGGFTFLPNRLIARIFEDGMFATFMPVIWLLIPACVYGVYLYRKGKLPSVLLNKQKAN